jgi:hypothetical protein
MLDDVRTNWTLQSNGASRAGSLRLWIDRSLNVIAEFKASFFTHNDERRSMPPSSSRRRDEKKAGR